MELEKVKESIGKCHSCRYHWEESFDPSPSGVSLGAGRMHDAGCHVEDYLAILPDYDDEWGNTKPCILWSGQIIYCEKHGYRIGEECGGCIDEAMAAEYEMRSEGGYARRILGA